MGKTERIYYLDWLRVSAFGVLILFHSWQPFANFSWLLESSHKTIVADILSVYFHTWRLHLIFFISGVGTWFAIRSDSQRFFLRRIQRLLVPFIFGAIVIAPCQYYYQFLQAGHQISFLDFIQNYPADLSKKDFKFDIFLWILEIGIHLWYLPYLFIMTMIFLPLLRLIRNKGIPENFFQALEQKPRKLFIFSLPAIILLMVLQPIFPEYTSVADFLIFASFFVYGFIFMKEHDRILPVIHKNHSLLLLTGIISSLMLIAFLLIEPLYHAAFNPDYCLNHFIVSVPIGMTAFAWPIYFVSLFSRKLSYADKMLPELNRSVLPVYIIHQSIIVVVGYYIIHAVDNGFLQFALIIMATIGGSILLYSLIKRFKLTRFLFGMNL